MALSELKKLVNDKWGQDIMFSPAEQLGIQNIPRFSSGSLMIDVDSGGGWPRGRLIEIIGPESVGKTFLINNAIASITNAGEKALLIDEEGSMDSRWASLCGVNLANLEIARSEYAEQALDILELAVQSGDFAFVGLDSIAALIPKDELDASTEDWQMALTARLMNKACRKVYRALNTARRKSMLTTVFLINQIRVRPGVSYGNPETTPGGNAVKYAASIRLDMRKEEMLKEDEEVYGQRAKYTFIKNKTAPPLKKGNFDYFVDGEGKGKIDNLRALAILAEDMGIITKAGSWYSGGWLSQKRQGMHGVVADLAAQKQAELNAYLQEIEAHYLDGEPLAFKF